MIEAMTKEAEVKKLVEKVRAVNPEIIVRIRAIDNKPYYLIRYLDLSDCKLHEAYGSFKLECVIGWLKEYFDVVDTNCEWISVSERLPEDETLMYWTTHEDGSLVMHGYKKRNGFIYNWEVDDLEKRERQGHVIAWTPIFEPEPYKGE